MNKLSQKRQVGDATATDEVVEQEFIQGGQEDIQITPEMVEAGRDALGEWVPPDLYQVSSSDLVKLVYCSMRNLARSDEASK